MEISFFFPKKKKYILHRSLAKRIVFVKDCQPSNKVFLTHLVSRKFLFNDKTIKLICLVYKWIDFSCIVGVSWSLGVISTCDEALSNALLNWPWYIQMTCLHIFETNKLTCSLASLPLQLSKWHVIHNVLWNHHCS